MKVVIVLGTRPEIIKLAPLIRQIGSKNCSIIFTGQHYDNQMGLGFMRQLDLPKPNYSLNIAKSDSKLQISEIIAKLSKILIKENPDTVMIQGDTNTVLASGICSLKCNIPISHIESGLRSNDWRMPEEHNRIVVDHISELLFAPTQNTKFNLKSEKVHGKIFVTGNTVIDSINIYSKISKKKSKLFITFSDYILLTLHRAENVDNKKILLSILKGLINSNENIIFPIHPRTKKRLREFGLYDKLLKNKKFQIIDSVGYFEILELMKNCSFIITDSGGIQEEATSPVIRKKVLVVRKTTDRPETVETNMAEIVGINEKNILTSIKKTMKNPKLSSRSTPYGKGDASEKILKILKKSF
jgi:UDP-N-acetylglucosamine 2-epimerase (non-hydrolysing)